MDGRTKRSQHLGTLTKTGWLSLQPPEFQGRMIAIGRWASVPRGRALYVFGEEADAIFGLGSGHLDISVPVDSEDVVIHRAPPGIWVGDGALLSGVPRMLTVVAATDCEVFRIPQAPLRRMLEENPGDWRHLHHLATLNGALATQALAEALVLPARPRFARVLLRLAQPDGTINATQEELGRMAGMSRAAFRRAFGALIAAGVLETGRGSVRIHDRAALAQEARLDPVGEGPRKRPTPGSRAESGRATLS
ncbi:Crp/Fnr family transcriptional regulator [Palleronia sp. KMU-117]|uniref:Crp/Fnr family transcriptional regulator n=1 Tax=Palleronia sp. KMU-117 TaxID=3434108 RepID=UPI003D71AF24